MCMKVFEIHFLFEMTPLNKSFFLIKEMTKKITFFKVRRNRML